MTTSCDGVGGGGGGGGRGGGGGYGAPPEIFFGFVYCLIAHRQCKFHLS